MRNKKQFSCINYPRQNLWNFNWHEISNQPRKIWNIWKLHKLLSKFDTPSKYSHVTPTSRFLSQSYLTVMFTYVVRTHTKNQNTTRMKSQHTPIVWAHLQHFCNFQECQLSFSFKCNESSRYDNLASWFNITSKKTKIYFKKLKIITQGITNLIIAPRALWSFYSKQQISS